MSDPADTARLDAPKRPWRDSLKVYLKPQVPPLLFLGFAAGLPFLLVFSTLSAWLRDVGVERATIGFFGWIGLTYSIKVFWAPVVDRVPLPLLTRLLGRRRSWMLLAQLGIAGGLIGMALIDPTERITAFALFALLIAFASATQDIALDAYRIEIAPVDLQGALAAAYQLGYRIALLAAGAGALLLAEYHSWTVAYLVMAALMGIGLATVLLVREPAVDPAGATAREREYLRLMGPLAENAGPLARAGRWFYGAVACPFIDFFRRNGWYALLILAFIGLFRVSDIAMGIMANPFYIDLGFTKAEIAEVAKLYGFFMTIAGALIGGFIVARYGALRPLLVAAILVAVTNVLFAMLANRGADIGWLIVTISADNLASGFAGSVFIAYLSGLTSTAYTATQYALFSSLMTLPGKFISGYSGVLVDAWGYHDFFLYTAALGIPSVSLVLLLMAVHHRILAQAARSQPGEAVRA